MVSPLFHRIAAPLLAGAALGLFAWMAGGATVSADVPGLFDDADGDFFPDDLEWMLMTDPQNADTDGDGVGDYLEAVWKGLPLDPDVEFPAADHEMRVLATTREDDHGVSQFWLHLLFRSMSGLDVSIEGFVPWIDLNGVQYPLHGLLSSVRLYSAVSFRGGEGTFVLISAPIATEETARRLLPFSLGVSAIIGDRPITTSAHYMDNGGETVALVALDRTRASLQTLKQKKQEGPFSGTNRLCVLELDVVGASVGGKICEVRKAECEPAHGLRCGVSCRDALGKMFFLPDGMSTITGG